MVQAQKATAELFLPNRIFLALGKDGNELRKPPERGPNMRTSAQLALVEAMADRRTNVADKASFFRDTESL